MLTIENKHERHVMSAANLILLEADPVKFLENFVTMVHYFQPESKCNQNSGNAPPPPPQKVQVSPINW